MKLVVLGRQFLLIVLCGGALLVLGNAVLGDPKTILRTPAAFNFPQQVPLEGWLPKDSQPLAANVLEKGSALGGWRYRYQHSTQLLTVDMIYMTDSSGPQDLKQKLHLFAQLPISLIQPSTIRQQSQIGFYSLFTHQKTAYLGTCINPDGSTTVTESQFKRNRKLHYLQFNRLILWLLGQQSFQDNRCLWVVLSLPLDRVAPQSTDQTLEMTGLNWIQWWQAHFPNR